jgi:outer membrane protein OmpA-like peptidoglycan-associated protein
MLCMIIQAKGQENKDSVSVIITNLGETINTPYDEYAPVISADGLMMIFTSRRPIFKNDIAKKNQGMENVYVSYYNDMTWKWSEAKMLGKTVNQEGVNNSAIALSNDGQRMLLYRGDPDGNIYESVLNGEEWSNPLKLPKPINSNKHESSASISPDGRTIYLVSNRNGGEGGLDIWVCHQDVKGVWGKAENLGPTVNTPGDEEGVFIHPDGRTLYFSSKGHNSMGGFDIFKSVFENGKWGVPVNLGNSINTTADDLFFTVTADGKTAYYSTGSAGNIGSTGVVRSSTPVNINNAIGSAGSTGSAGLAVPPTEIGLAGSTGTTGSSGIASVTTTSTNTTTTSTTSTTTTTTGLVADSLTKDSVVLISRGSAGITTSTSVSSDTMNSKTVVLVANSGNTGSTGDTLKSVVKNDSLANIGATGMTGATGETVNKESVNTINVTDSTTSSFADIVSPSSDTFVPTLIGGGVGRKDIYEITFRNNIKTESRLTLFKGVVIDFKTIEPIGTDIEITDNDKNEVIAKIQSNSITGKFLVSLPAGKNYGIAVKKDGYLFYSENYNIPDSAAYKEIHKNILLQRIDVGNKVTLKNIFYDYGAATLLPESIAELNQLVKLMSLNTDIKIEVASYTDDAGSPEFNLALSQARAQAVLDFLFAAGISKEQITAKGYGETSPTAFFNDTEEGRKLNRRTELKILDQ